MSGSSSSSEEGEQVYATELHESRVEAIKQRRNLPADIRTGSVAVLHAVPTGIEMSNYAELQSTLPEPPIFGQSEGDPESSRTTDSGKVQTGQPIGTKLELTSYTYISDEGWFEAVTTDPFVPGLVLDGLAEEFVLTLKGGLDCLLQLAAQLPIYVCISLIDVEQFRMQAGHYQHAVDSLPAECTVGPAGVAQFEADTGEVVQNLMARIEEQAEL